MTTPLLRILAQRILFTFISLFILSLLCFTLFQIPEKAQLVSQYSKFSNRFTVNIDSSTGISTTTSPESLSKSLIVRYRQFLSSVISFEFGQSYYDNAPVIKTLSDHLKVSSLFFILSTLLTLPLALPLGVYLSVRRASMGARFLTQLLVSLNSFPTLILSLLLLIGFASYRFPLFPLGTLPFESGLILLLKHAFLPLCVYLSQSVSLLALLVKDGIMQEGAKPYALLVRSKGASITRLLLFHLLPNCTGSILQFFCHWVLIFFSQSLVVETIFTLPGLGQLSFLSTQRQDYPVLQGLILLLALAHLSLNLFRDLISQLIDYRQRNPV